MVIILGTGGIVPVGVIPFLICFPFVAAVLMFCIRVNKVRNAVAYVSAVIIMAASVFLCAQWVAQGAGKIKLYYHTEAADRIILIAELILMCVVTYLCFKHKRWYISLLSIVPTLGIAWLELFGPEMTDYKRIYLDHLSILMCLIVGIIGSLIVIYAVGYMHGYQHYHTDIPDRRYYFFMVLFLFLGAMFGFVLSSDLLWIDFFWEVTSVCSFLLIGYTKLEEAEKNSFRALWMNLLGGCALAAGIIYYALADGNTDLQTMVWSGSMFQHAALVAVALTAFAALTKAAQMPFSRWLLGAMVAPTPSSALLHSATMVKAGIYILFRLSPALKGSLSGQMVAFVGGFTFLAASFIAIAQSDAKKVLAMSTISNLGLMTACAGVGRPETIWAGVFLMIFHAISKSLLFQDVGATENAIHSRDVEEMQGLLYRLPRLAIIMFIGICGMYLAPFGMLISKWAALKASVESRNIILVFFICFGSATTSFYWTKWLGKLIARSSKPPVKDITKTNEMISLGVHTVLMIAICALFPLVSQIYVDPLVTDMFGSARQVIPTGVLYLLVLLILFFFAVPVFAYLRNKHAAVNRKLSYMNGINTGSNDAFVDSFGEEKKLVVSNLYLRNVFGVRRLMVPCEVITSAVIIVTVAMTVGGAL
jgi:ech hydrogenase subunit A